MSQTAPQKTGALLRTHGAMHPIGVSLLGLVFAVVSLLVFFVLSLGLAKLWSADIARENAGTDPAVLVFAFSTYVVSFGFLIIYAVIMPVYYGFIRKSHSDAHYNILLLVLLVIEVALFVVFMPFSNIPLTSAVLFGPVLVVTAVGVWIFARILTRTPA